MSILELTGTGKGFLNRTSVVQALIPTIDKQGLTNRNVLTQQRTP